MQHLAVQVWDIGVLVEELESQNQATIQKHTEEVLRMSVQLDHLVGVLAMKSYAPTGSRLLTDTQYKEWTNRLKLAECDYNMVILSSCKVGHLREALAQNDHQISSLEKSGTWPGVTLSEVNGMCSSYHYFFNLTVNEAMLIVACWHGILDLESREAVVEAYTIAAQDGMCNCHACTNVGPTYSDLSTCEIRQHKQIEAAAGTAPGEITLANVAAVLLVPSYPTKMPMEDVCRSPPKPVAGAPIAGELVEEDSL